MPSPPPPEKPSDPAARAVAAAKTPGMKAAEKFINSLLKKGGEDDLPPSYQIARNRKHKWQKKWEDSGAREAVCGYASYLSWKALRFAAWDRAGRPGRGAPGAPWEDGGPWPPEPMEPPELRFLTDNDRAFSSTLVKEEPPRSPGQIDLNDLAKLSDEELHILAAQARSESEALSKARAQAEAIDVTPAGGQA